MQAVLNKNDRAASVYGAVQEFAEAAFRLETLGDLAQAVDDVSKWLGFDNYAIINHVDFGRIVPGIRVTNYPVEFIGRLRELGLTRDPVLRASERAGAGFSWDEIPSLTPLRDADHAYMEEAARHGLVSGFTVPNNVPGEILGSCHFSVGAGSPLPRMHFAAAQSVGAFGFEAARRLAGEMVAQGPSPDPAPLTPRQRDCLIQVARGKSDSVIAQLLGLRPRTVNEYVEAAKRRYVVATRQQLVVRALFCSEISFSEVLH